MPKNKKSKLIFILTAFILVAGIIITQYQKLHDWVQGYRVIWLTPSTMAIDVNDHGQALTFSRKQNNLSSSPFAYWQESEVFDAPKQQTLTFEHNSKEYPNILPRSINSKGFIVATTTNQLGLMNSGRVFIMKGNIFHEEIQTFTNEPLHPLDINDSNAVVGYRFQKVGMGSSLAGGSTTKETKAFYWSKEEGIIDVHEKLLAKQSQANVINNSGALAGHFQSTNRWEPYYYKNGEVTKIPWRSTMQRDSEILDINNSGKVLLQENLLLDPVPGSGKAVAIWSKSSGIKFIKGTTNIQIMGASSINDHNQVLVETKVDNQQKYMIYRDGVFTPLPNIRPNHFIQYNTLTNNGWLAGFVKLDKVEEYQGFVMKLIR